MKTICLLFYSLLITVSSFSQELNDEVLLTIDNKKIYKEEFQRIYDKNKTNLTSGDVTPVEDYLELFINFKLKVIEAEKQGYDTLKSFINEFNGYKNQLANPYLVDNEANKKIIKEAYDRMQYEIRASHILIKLVPDALPVDTLAAYEKALEIRKRILRGEPFENVAKGSSDDPSVKNNGGDLGYFSVFQMIYPFESAVYNTKIGEITMPVRTKFGYHIVKVKDKRKAWGQVKVAHIMLTVPRGTSSEVEKQNKQLINEIYHKAKQGQDFAELAKEYSDDKGSARNGGELPWFGVGRMVEEFEKAAFSLNTNGEISQPVRTSFGWHVIKRIDRKEIPNYNEAIPEIERKISKDQRYEVARKALINKLKDEYNFIEKQNNIPATYDTVANVFVLKKQYLDENTALNNILFSFLGKDYTEENFVKYINNNKGRRELRPYDYKLLYEQFKEDKILEIEKSRLKEKYPDYKYILNEYYDGMLLFEITDKHVWSKAVEDSVGLKKYFENNRKLYIWAERWEGTVYICSSEQVYNKVEKAIGKKSFGKKLTNKDLMNKFNVEKEELKIESGIFEKGDNKVIDYLVWHLGDQAENELVLIKGKKLSPTEKLLSECKGLVISDYQDYLDEKWIKSLRVKYNIQVNKSVLTSIK
ncbi:MAG: peptidylprolyl isomerase [Marinilabiliales bacterium]|nr:MAG: peptidylprolyl isomerase [Marinilabiliales bacterium]